MTITVLFLNDEDVIREDGTSLCASRSVGLAYTTRPDGVEIGLIAWVEKRDAEYEYSAGYERGVDPDLWDELTLQRSNTTIDQLTAKAEQLFPGSTRQIYKWLTYYG